eukprot:scaffold53647_cov59-Attheya_sp.AAC.1
MEESAMMTSVKYDISLLLSKVSQQTFLSMVITTLGFICGSKRPMRTWGCIHKVYRSHRGMMEGNMAHCKAAAVTAAHCDLDN